MPTSLPDRPTLPPLAHITILDPAPVPADNRLEGEWPDRWIANPVRPELHSFVVDDPKAMALIYAGGGYTKLMYDKEGTEVALWLNSLGLDAHILVHRLPGAPIPDNQGPAQMPVHPKDVALRDGLSAMDELASRYPDLPLFHVGLSSGGHLSGVMACQSHGVKVLGALIAYAPINANHRDHKYPEGKPDYPPVEKQDFYDDWPIGLLQHPHGMPSCPIFMAYALTDRSVPIQHALRMIESASAAELDLDAHIFGAAPHGFALRNRSGSHGSWTDLASDWFRRQLAKA